jgi:osmotically-inducible protein OsmY
MADQNGQGLQGIQRSNDRIYDEAGAGILRHGHVDAGGVTVRVEHGDVTLEGTVSSHREKRMAEEDVNSLPGIQNVHNRLQVIHPQVDLQSGGPSGLDGVSGPVSETVEADPGYSRVKA